MMIKCKNCEGESPVGSIFCRNCGSKLDMGDLDRNMKKRLKNKKNFHFLSRFFRIILVLFFLAAAYGAYLIFEPVKYFRPITAMTKDQESSAMALYDKIDRGGAPGTSYKFTSDQLSYLAARIFTKKDSSITVSFPENKYFGFTITKNLISYSSVNLNVRVTAVCELTIESDKRGKSALTANLKYLKLGELKLPEWYNQLFVGDFTPYKSSRKVESFLSKIDEIKIENGQLEIVSKM